MDKSEWHLLVAQVTLTIGIMMYLLLVENLSPANIFYDWGVPLGILIALFTAYPLYKLGRNICK